MLDFLADTITYGLSLVLIGGTLRTRASAALLKGFSLSAMGALGVRFDCLPDAVSLPKAEVMGMISVLALAANLTPVLRLTLPWTVLATVHIGKPYRDSNCVAERTWSRPPVPLLNGGSD